MRAQRFKGYLLCKEEGTAAIATAPQPTPEKARKKLNRAIARHGLDDFELSYYVIAVRQV